MKGAIKGLDVEYLMDSDTSYFIKYGLPLIQLGNVNHSFKWLVHFQLNLFNSLDGRDYIPCGSCAAAGDRGYYAAIDATTFPIAALVYFDDELRPIVQSLYYLTTDDCSFTSQFHFIFQLIKEKYGECYEKDWLEQGYWDWDSRQQ